MELAESSENSSKRNKLSHLSSSTLLRWQSLRQNSPTDNSRKYRPVDKFPDKYPNEMPRVYVDAPSLKALRTDITPATSATCIPQCGIPAPTISLS